VSAPPLRDALAWWLRLGCVSFGGPAGQIALMHRELVERRRWIGERRFLHALNYCMLLPGPEAQQVATYVGWLLHGTLGGIAAGTLFVLPGACVVVALAWAYVTFGDTNAMMGMLRGVEPAVLALVLHAAWRMARRALRTPLLGAIALGTLVGRVALDLPFPGLLLGAALVGAAFPKRVVAGPAVHGPTMANADGPSPLLADDAEPPAHARLSAVRVGLPLAIGLTLAALGLVGAQAADPAVLGPMARFFGGAALLTFGGAYAVLPYVRDGAVEAHRWITDADMMAALALGESTPGPLVLVNTFVGFAGGWHAGGAAMALAAAGVVTLATFLPSFVFVLAGGPLVEATRGSVRLAGPMNAMGAAVVAMISDLARSFAAHALWRGEPVSGAPELFALLLACAALLGLVRYEVGVVKVVAGAALLGAVWTALAGGASG
jgi:chromate transporter